jgi:hypothetical protein
MNLVALPVNEGYVTLGRLIEREQGFEAVRVDGNSLGLFRTADAATAALADATRIEGESDP